MIYTAKVPVTDPAIAGACARFASEITPVLPMDRMAIVLLEPEGDTSRVVYSWANPSITRRYLPGTAGLRSTLSQRAPSPLRIPLNGEEGLLGEVLVRGCQPGLFDASRREMVRQCADHLTLALENIRLRRSLNSNQQVNDAVRRINQAAAPEAPLSRGFRQFATEIKAMVEYQRLSIYLVNQGSDLAICAYRTGQGVGRHRSGESTRLSDSGLGESAASGESRIFPDLSERGCPVVWNQIMPSEIRSAMMVPVTLYGKTLGMVLLEHRSPRAYGAVDQTCLEEVVAALTPSLARLASPNQPGSDPRQPAQDGIQQELARIFGASQSLDEIFPPFVDTVAKVIAIDGACISWIDSEGYDFPDLWASPGHGTFEPESAPATGFSTGISIETRLYFKGEIIGVLTIFRDRGKGFSMQDQATLDELGIQVSPVVQAGRLYVHSRRQAHRLEQLNRLEIAPAPAGSLSSLIETLAGQATSIGQAEWSAAFMYDHQRPGLSPIAGADILGEGSPQDLLGDLGEGLMEEIADLAAKCFDEGAPVRRSLIRRRESAALGRYPAKGRSGEVPQVESWRCLAIPLQNSIEKAGVLVLGRGEGIPWTQEEVYLLESFVGEAANEIESARLKDAGRRLLTGEPKGV
ncbi:MAG: hypothetical protein IIC99_04250 [Chloroflexi bacterium]|nr:hypothetical protein [Chloroflexota bacterium]